MRSDGVVRARLRLRICESGVGKTHLVRQYVLDRNAGYTRTEEGLIPVLYVQMPLPFSLRDLYVSIQESLGSAAPKADRTITDIQRRTLALLAARSVEMIIFDNAHHIGMSRNVSMVEALESLIYLSNTANVALILVGPEEIRAMSQHDMRFLRRFSASELRRFEPANEEFIAFLRSIEAQIDPFPVSLSDAISNAVAQIEWGIDWNLDTSHSICLT